MRACPTTLSVPSRGRSSRPAGRVVSWRRWKTRRVLSVCYGPGARGDRIGILQPSCFCGPQRPEKGDVEAATAQMEFALRVEGWM
jgi:hypothetical protein